MSHQRDRFPSESEEMYLKEIYLRSGKHDFARTGDIARSLAVSPPSVTEMLTRLEEKRLVTYEKHEGARLTELGMVHAKDILQKHCRIERFLVECLDVTSGFHKEACRMEHAMSNEVADRLDTFVELESECPACYDATEGYCTRLNVTSATKEDTAETTRE